MQVLVLNWLQYWKLLLKNAKRLTTFLEISCCCKMSWLIDKILTWRLAKTELKLNAFFLKNSFISSAVDGFLNRIFVMISERPSSTELFSSFSSRWCLTISNIRIIPSLKLKPAPGDGRAQDSVSRAWAVPVVYLKITVTPVNWGWC